MGWRKGKVPKHMARKMHAKADAIKQEVRQPYDFQADWAAKRNDTSLPPEERFAGEPWYEKNKNGLFRFPVGR